MKTIAAILFCLFVLPACSSVIIRHGETTVSSHRLFMDSNLDGLKIKTQEGTVVTLDKKGDLVQTEALSAIVGAAVKAASPIPVK
jgi:hypothetical protein